MSLVWGNCKLTGSAFIPYCFCCCQRVNDSSTWHFHLLNFHSKSFLRPEENHFNGSGLVEFPFRTSQKSLSPLHLLFLQLDLSVFSLFPCPHGILLYFKPGSGWSSIVPTQPLSVSVFILLGPCAAIFAACMLWKTDLCSQAKTRGGGGQLFSMVRMVSSKYPQCKPTADTTTNLLFHSLKFLSHHEMTRPERKWHTAQDVNTGGQDRWLWSTVGQFVTVLSNLYRTQYLVDFGT